MRRVDYETRDGWHHITDQYGEVRVCQANPDAKAYPLPALLDVVPMERLGPWTQRKVLRAWGDYEAGVRFFEADQAGGVAELPIGNVATGWREFLHEAIHEAVSVDEAGTPVLNLHSVEAMRSDLGRVGVPRSMADRFLVSLVNITRSGHNAHFLSPAFKRFILGGSTALGLLFVGLGLGWVLGIDMGADPLISSWWYDSNARRFVVPVLLVLGSWFYVRATRGGGV